MTCWNIRCSRIRDHHTLRPVALPTTIQQTARENENRPPTNKQIAANVDIARCIVEYMHPTNINMAKFHRHFSIKGLTTSVKFDDAAAAADAVDDFLLLAKYQPVAEPRKYGIIRTKGLM